MTYRRSVLSAFLVPAVVAGLAACAASGNADDARELRDQLGALPGVTQAVVDYTAPVTLDSGKVGVTVTAAPDATPQQLLDVLTTSYAAFAGSHHDEETDLEVQTGDDTVHLRGFRPEATASAVTDAARAALDVVEGDVARDARVRAEIMTQDVAAAPHVETTFRVTVPGGPAAVLATLDGLEAAYADVPRARWSVQSGQGPAWELGADDGFPAAEQRALWARLGADLPAGATVRLGDSFATVALPDSVRPSHAARIVRRHVALLGGAQQAWYELEVGDTTAVSLLGGECHVAEGPVAAAVERMVADSCNQVLHPGEVAAEPTE